MDRISKNTPDNINKVIRENINESIAYYAGHLDKIPCRLEKLEKECDIERALLTNAASLAFLGSILALRSKKWMVLPLAVGGFLLQHGIQGWCPPLAILRALGFRTRQEINTEKTALLALQGKFSGLNDIKELPDKERADRVIGVLEA